MSDPRPPHNFMPIPEGKGRFEYIFEPTNWTIGYFWTTERRELCIGPACFCFHRVNINGHRYCCDCSACCVGCIKNDPAHAFGLLDASRATKLSRLILEAPKNDNQPRFGLYVAVMILGIAICLGIVAYEYFSVG